MVFNKILVCFVFQVALIFSAVVYAQNRTDVTITGLPSLEEKNLALKGVIEDARKVGIGCDTIEVVSLVVFFELVADSFADTKAKYEEKLKLVSDFAKKNNIEKFDLQSQTYSASSSYERRGEEFEMQSYRLSGSANYVMKKSSDAFRMADYLAKQNIRSNVKARTHKSGICENIDPAIP